jgi:hypothetical protein
MYTRSMTYSLDNYSTAGIQTSLALTKNWIFQLGFTVGTEAMPWHWNAQIANPFPNLLYPNNTMPKDPGAVPSVTMGVRWTSDSDNDSIYVVADVINDGNWGYNNMQWLGMVYYHKFNDQWHILFETSMFISTMCSTS